MKTFLLTMFIISLDAVIVIFTFCNWTISAPLIYLVTPWWTAVSTFENRYESSA